MFKGRRFPLAIILVCVRWYCKYGIRGFEPIRMIRRGHCLTCKPHVKDEVHFINKLFDVFTAAA